MRDKTIIRKMEPHRHCSICEKSISLDKKFCSQKCRMEFLKQEKIAKRKSKIQVIVVIVLIGLMVFPFFL